MADYQAMYALLFHEMTSVSVIEELQSVQRQPEAMYISSESPKRRVINPDELNDKKPDQS